MKYTTKDKMEAAKILEKARKLFGPNGLKWIQSDTHNDDGYCVIGAINQVASGAPDVVADSDDIDALSDVELPHRIAIKAMARTFGKEIAEYNDTDGRKFEQIAKGFDRAIASLKKGDLPQ